MQYFPAPQHPKRLNTEMSPMATTGGGHGSVSLPSSSVGEHDGEYNLWPSSSCSSGPALDEACRGNPPRVFLPRGTSYSKSSPSKCNLEDGLPRRARAHVYRTPDQKSQRTPRRNSPRGDASTWASPMPDQILKMDFVEEFFIGFDPHPTPATAHRPPSSSPGVFDNQKSHRYNTGSGKTATDATEARNPPRIERVPRTAPHGGLHDWPRHTS